MSNYNTGQVLFLPSTFNDNSKELPYFQVSFFMKTCTHRHIKLMSTLSIGYFSVISSVSYVHSFAFAEAGASNR